MIKLANILPIIFLLSLCSSAKAAYTYRLVIDDETNTASLQVRADDAQSALVGGEQISTISFQISQGDGNITGINSTNYDISSADKPFYRIGGNAFDAPEAWPNGVFVELAELSLIEAVYDESSITISPGTNPVNRPAITIDGNSEQVTIAQTILPVEISFLNATKEDKHSHLNWETSSEINNDFFDVERSADGKIFQKIGKVQGNGTTTEVQNYTFLDRTPEAGLNYYRLKQVDFNGEYEYTKTVTVDFRDGTEGDVKIFPNPAVDFVNIQLDRTYETINITNQLGQRVANIAANQFEDNSLKLNVAGYAPGVYYLEAQLGTEIVNKQFVKVK